MADIGATQVTPAPAGSISVRRLRLAVFTAIALFMLAGPMIEQVFGVRTTFWRSWTMFSAIGMGVIDASFTRRDSDGALVPLDRFALLGEPRNGKLKRIEDVDELAHIIKSLCAALGPGTDLRVKARQATREGWQVIVTDAQNACAI